MTEDDPDADEGGPGTDEGEPSSDEGEPTSDEGEPTSDEREPTGVQADADGGDEAPLSDLRRRLEERRGRPNGSAGDGGPVGPSVDAPRSDAAGDAPAREGDSTDGSPFEVVDVETVDGEALWDAVVDGTAASGPSPESVDAGAEVDDEVRVVDKREFCQRCPFFAAPPAVACEHDGAEIVEAVDGDSFRVRGCPMVDDDGGWRSRLIDE